MNRKVKETEVKQDWQRRKERVKDVREKERRKQKRKRKTGISQ